MGYNSHTIHIPVRVSRHNSQQDRDDDQAADDLVEAVNRLIEDEPRYARIVPYGAWVDM